MTRDKHVSMLTAWIEDNVLSAGCRGVVLGMSGGVDSSLLAVLCKKAFPTNTLGIIMPCHSADQDREHAELVARQFDIPTKTVVLNNVYDSLLYVLPDFKADPDMARQSLANLKPRLRMITLYFIANQLNYIVVGSSNRSELSIGYFTKYGDGGVDILPLGNLLKKEVRELARYLRIPLDIINKAPSAGLWSGQSDEGDMGFSYVTLDRYLASGSVPLGVQSRIEFLKASSQHKKVTPPIPDF